MHVILYTILSVVAVSLVSLIGVLSLPFKENKMSGFLLYFVSFSAGALFGDVFIHLLPQAAANGLTLQISLYVLLGVVISFFIERVIHWHHCHHSAHHTHCEKHTEPFAYMNLLGDLVHNFIDGLIIGGSYIVSIPIGIATTIAVVLHEIPQEIGDFGVLLHAGFSRGKALFYNFIVSLSAIVGAVIALVIGVTSESFTLMIIPFAAGGFIYIAGSDLIPELHKEKNIPKSMLQLSFFLVGIFVMMLLLALD